MKSQNKIKHVYSVVEKKEMRTAYGMVAPAIVGLAVFTVIPLIMAIYYSFFDWNFYKDSVFVGLKNYKTILQTELFRLTFLNSLKFLFTIAPISLVIPFLFALLVKTLSSKFSMFVRTTIYVPGMVSGIVTGAIFSFVFNYKGGIVNQIIMALGFKRVAFLTTEVGALISILIPNLWLGIGGGTILNYAALMGIPDEYYEAAALDGAGKMAKFFHITIPQMKNIIIYQLIGAVAGSLQMFELPLSITGGGPRGSTTTPVLYMYNNYLTPGISVSFTISGAVLLMFIIAILNACVFKLINSEKSLEG